jgi:AcrR family transcriptional regulator
MASRDGASARDRILDAASDIVCEVGARKLTLDAVAVRASLSKGGVLYHFRSKDALLRGMIERMIGESAAERERLRPKLDGRPNVECRLTLAVALRQWIGSKRQVAGAMLAASAESPGLLDPVRDVIAEDWTRIRDTADDADAAMVARLAVEGLCSLDIHGLSPLAGEDLPRVLRALDRLLEHGIAKEPVVREPVREPVAPPAADMLPPTVETRKSA